LETSDALAHAFLAVRRVRIELTFAIGIGVTVILVLVICYLAARATGGGPEQWAIFIAYIGALRLALAGGSQAIGAVVGISRFYPQLMRYYVFTQNARMIDQRHLGRVRRGDMLTLGTLHNGADIAVSAGQRIALATTDTVYQMRSALLDARLPRVGMPLGSVIIDNADASIGDAAVAIVQLDRQPNGRDSPPPALDERLDDSVTLIVHRNARRVGSFEETHLLTLDDGEFCRFAPLGTSESDAALEEFSRKSAKRRKKRFIDAEEDDEDGE
jgi:hypothetical protein